MKSIAIRPQGLRIAFICFSSARGGLELMLVRLAHSLQAMGHSVFMVSPGNNAIEEDCNTRGIRHYALSPLFKYLDPIASGTLRRYFIRHDTQVAVVGTSKDISTVVLAKRHFASLRVVYFQQMQSGLMKKDLFHRWSHSHLDRWITLTRKMMDTTQSLTTVPSSIIDVVPLGVDLEKFSPAKHHRGISRSLFGLPKRGPIIGLIGRFDPQKGQETFLRAASIVLKKVPKVHFVMAGEETRGESGYLDQLRQLVQTEGIGENVQFLPFTERVPELLSAFDITVMPSFSETYGYLAIESMAMGVPVVGTNAGGLPEIIEDQKTGILVAPRDHESLAEALISLLSNPRRYRSMAQEGRRRAEKSFDYVDGVRLFEKSLVRALS